MFTSIHYLESNCLLAAGYLLIWGLETLGRTLPFPAKYAHVLKAARLALLAIFLMPAIHLISPKPTFLIPSAQIWAGSTMRAMANPELVTSTFTLGANLSRHVSWAEPLRVSLGGLFFVGILLWFVRYCLAFRRLARLYRSSCRIRRVGSVEIRVCDHLIVPFSIWLPFRSWVCLPGHLVASPGEWLIALRHEIQHHRQGDTRWTHLMELLRCLFFANPFVHFLAQRISVLQEFACDEALVDQGKVSPQAYGGCLLKVALTARDSHPIAAGTTGMAVGTSGTLLKRRIKTMLTKKKRYLNTSVAACAGMMSFLFLVSLAWASQGLVQDRRVSFQQAQNLAEAARKNSDFPLTVNPDVVRELNRFLGTPDGREFVKTALERLENHRALLITKFEQYGLPEELLAVPMIESGFESLPESSHPMHSAGFWQFVPQTARNYGLIVNANRDERLDIKLSTDAACRYLAGLNFRFQNWELAILSYNTGEQKIQRGIEKTKTRNAWKLIEAGFGGDSGYLARAMAAVLILSQPSLVQ